MIDPDKLNRQEITNVIIGVKPNTYTFTKALAENVLASEGVGLPISIIIASPTRNVWQINIWY